MSIRIRVYPQNGGYGGNALGGYGGYGAHPPQPLRDERKINELKLGYERQIMQQQIGLVKVQAQAQYGGFGGASPYGAVASPYGAYGGFGGGVPVAYRGAGLVGGYPPQFGQGQVNYTNQYGGRGNQCVTNSNVYQNQSYSMQTGSPFGGFGFPFGGGQQGGGFLSNMLGGMF
ncbi:MAG: hypothetical protein H7123_03240 [Thermoleophilia bacterium]|nr:hypothetical protein [Thermoleophilia bacterium]